MTYYDKKPTCYEPAKTPPQPKTLYKIKEREDGTYVVTLKNNHKLIADAIDLPMILSKDWVVEKNKAGKVDKVFYRAGRGTRWSIARLLLNPKNHVYIRHINGNKLDNRRCNLALQNRISKAQRDASKHRVECYLGVRFTGGGRNPFEASITVGGNRIVLGNYVSALAAAAAHDVAALEHFGTNATCNL